MPLLLPIPEAQFLDQNGHPYAGGTIATLIPGTDTPKDTWQDSAGTVLNTNPIILDAAGRAIIWGDGEYRFILKDSDGNLIYDQLTSTPPASLTTSDVNALIAVETARAEAAEATLTTNLAAEVTRAEAEEANLQSQISAIVAPTLPLFRFGTGLSDGAGNGAQSFSAPFPAACDSVVAQTGAASVNCALRIITVNAAGFTCFIENTNNTAGVATVFWYIAIGH